MAFRGTNHRGGISPGNKFALGNRGGPGQKPKYKPEFAVEVFNLALMGLTDEQIGTHFGTHQVTITKWKQKHAEFGHAVKNARDIADGRVCASLYQRRLGYNYKKSRGFRKVTEKNEITGEWEEREEEFFEVIHVPPDPTSIIFWLANRRRDYWKRGDAGFEPQVQQERRSKLHELWNALRPDGAQPLSVPEEGKPS